MQQLILKRDWLTHQLVTLSEEHLISSATDGNQWYNSLGLIPGATDQDFSPPTTDTYYVIAHNIKGCQSMASNKIDYGFSGINHTDGKDFWVYPNPFTGKLYIDYTTKIAGDVKIAMYNSVGIEIRNMEESIITAGRHTASIDGSHWAAGIYLCKISSSDGVQFSKVIIKE